MRRSSPGAGTPIGYEDRRRAGGAGCRTRPHGRSHAAQPSRVPLGGRRRHASGRGPVLDLQHLAPNQIRYCSLTPRTRSYSPKKTSCPPSRRPGRPRARDRRRRRRRRLPELEELESLEPKPISIRFSVAGGQPDDLATLIYTSGTTGPPKGVELTHTNVIAEFSAIVDSLSMQPTDRITSYLPHAHIADRVHRALRRHGPGGAGDRCRRPQGHRAGAAGCSPHGVARGARVWHKIKAGIETSSAPRRRSQAAVGVVGHRHRRPRRPPTWPASPVQITCPPPQSRRPAGAGQGARGSRPGPVARGVTAAAPIPVETLEFFWELGIPV